MGADGLAGADALGRALQEAQAEEAARLKETKAARRKELRAARDAMPEAERAEADAAICARVQTLSAWGAAEVVLTYLSMGSEVETRGIISAALAAGKRVALPRCVPHSRKMRWHEVGVPAYEQNLERLSFGVLEPADDDATLVDPTTPAAAIAIVPGLSFDHAGFRIGYGGGFYDEFLASFPGTSVGVCREAQLADWLDCVEAWDVAVSMVVTERRVV
jgi:5-formyltetrahydrofolate cyclo-ligase